MSVQGPPQSCWVSLSLRTVRGTKLKARFWGGRGRNGHGTPGVAPPALGGGEGLSWPSGGTSPRSQEHRQPSWQQGRGADARSAQCPPGLPGPFLSSCFPDGVPPQVQDSALVELLKLFVSHFSSLLKSAWMAARAFGDPATLSFVLSANLLRVHPNPSSQPLVKMLKGLDALWTPGVL